MNKIRKRLEEGEAFTLYSNATFTYNLGKVFSKRLDDHFVYEIRSGNSIIGTAHLSYKRMTIKAFIHGIYLDTIANYDAISFVDQVVAKRSSIIEVIDQHVDKLGDDLEKQTDQDDRWQIIGAIEFGERLIKSIKGVPHDS